jgi:hypothetical protein
MKLKNLPKTVKFILVIILLSPAFILRTYQLPNMDLNCSGIVGLGSLGGSIVGSGIMLQAEGRGFYSL